MTKDNRNKIVLIILLLAVAVGYYTTYQKPTYVSPVDDIISDQEEQKLREKMIKKSLTPMSQKKAAEKGHSK